MVGEGGCAFFEFPLIEQLGAYKTGYRKALDGLPLDEAAQARVVAEAVRSFELNSAITDALGPS